MNITNILLIEDSPEYREVIAFGLSEEPDFNISAQFNTADAALRHLREQSATPNIILLDLNLPGLSGIDSIPEFKSLFPEIEILVLTESDKKSDILDAIALGASGYLLKESSLRQIIAGIRTVLAGGASLDPGMARYLLEDNRRATPRVATKALSPRELEVIEQVASGLSQKQIADELGISHKTVDFHVRQAYKKLGVPNAPAAVAKAYEMGSLPRPK